MYQNSRKILSILSAISLLALPFAPFWLTPQKAKAQSTNFFTNPNFTGNNSGWLTGVHGIPDGWILAPSDANYSTGDFLVMQYEGKAWDTQENEVVATGGGSNNWAGNNSQTRYRAISMPQGNPWRYIAQSSGNYDAIEACQDAYILANLPSGSTHLITNDEWMTLARNIEQQTSNWANGIIGSTVSGGGGLFRGNTGQVTSVDYNGSDPEGGTGRNTKARHFLDNGNEIWDLSGNVQEWTNNTIQVQYVPVAWDGVNEVSGANWSDFSAGLSSRYIQFWKSPPNGLQQSQVGPSDTSWNANNGVGRIYHDSNSESVSTTIRAFLRGGRWNNTADAGVFTLYLHSVAGTVPASAGFRCASDPVEILHQHSPNEGIAGSDANELSAGSVTQGKIFQKIDLDDTSDTGFMLSALAYNNNSGDEGDPIDENIASMYADGEKLATTYESVGDGWYKLSASVVGSDDETEYGLAVEPDNTVLLDSLYLGNSEGVTVTATVPEELSFTISSDTCSLGSLDANATKTCTHTMSASTNGVNGYVLSYLPTTTLTSTVSQEIEETGATGASSSAGTAQFGFNLVDNSNPDVGADASGGVGSVSTNYNTANTFSFNTNGATIASSSTPSMPTTYTATYMANIASDTPAGEYSTVVTYVITASY